jgi:hypothetical protein
MSPLGRFLPVVIVPGAAAIEGKPTDQKAFCGSRHLDACFSRKRSFKSNKNH